MNLSIDSLKPLCLFEKKSEQSSGITLPNPLVNLGRIVMSDYFNRFGGVNPSFVEIISGLSRVKARCLSFDICQHVSRYNNLLTISISTEESDAISLLRDIFHSEWNHGQPPNLWLRFDTGNFNNTSLLCVQNCVIREVEISHDSESALFRINFDVTFFVETIL